MTPYLYRMYGLTFASTLELPECSPTKARPDVTIDTGEVPQALAQPTRQGIFYEVDATQCLLKLERIAGARYLVRNGNEIVVERMAAANEQDIRLFLLGSCLAALLYQRHALPLHGSAIQTAKGSVLFVGLSGSGKSTLAAAFCQRGYAFLADDISVIAFDQTNVPSVLPGCPRLKVWADAAKLLAQETDLQQRIRPGIEKYALTPTTTFTQQPAPIAAIYVLQPANTQRPALEPLQGMAKVAPLQHNAYRDQLALEMGKQPWLFQQIARLAGQVKVGRVTRPRQQNSLKALVEMLEQDFA